MIPLAMVRFVLWEGAIFAAATRLARLLPWRDEEFWLAVLALDVTLESSIAALFSFTGLNAQLGYWLVAAICLASCGKQLLSLPRPKVALNPFVAALAIPLILLSFKPVDEIDSINYLHYLIEWMANRATPYTFATNYVAFWELSFLPTWMVTRVDFFFPILALKAVVLMGLALWLVGRELSLPRGLLTWTIAACLAMQHYWYGPSGVPTLKNDVLHGIGFVLMVLVAVRAGRGALAHTDLVLLAFGVAFGAVKYTGIFEAGLILVALVLFRRIGWKALAAILGSFLLTSGHYYLHNLLLYGSPFYPFQINLGPIHLPGTADLSNTSILYSLHNPELWRLLFLPAGGVSPSGLLFPVILASILPIASLIWLRSAFLWLRDRRPPVTLDWVALALLCGWMLYFRSVFSASASPGDLLFLRNGLNSIRYVDGVLAGSELLLIALLARLPWLARAKDRSLTVAAPQGNDSTETPQRTDSAEPRPSEAVKYSAKPFLASNVLKHLCCAKLGQRQLFHSLSGSGLWGLYHSPLASAFVAVNLIGRLAPLYGRIELFHPWAWTAAALAVGLLFLLARRRPLELTAAGLILVAPWLVEHNRQTWTAYWDDLKPALADARSHGMAILAMPDGGYFAGHVVAAGNPVDPKVEALLPEELAALPDSGRPRYLAVLVAPGTEATQDWESRYGAQLRSWGYMRHIQGKSGALFERGIADRVSGQLH